MVRAPDRDPRYTRGDNVRCVGWRARIHGPDRGARALRERIENRWDGNDMLRAGTGLTQADTLEPSHAARQRSKRTDEQGFQLYSRFASHVRRGGGFHPNYPVPPRQLLLANPENFSNQSFKAVSTNAGTSRPTRHHHTEAAESESVRCPVNGKVAPLPASPGTKGLVERRCLAQPECRWEAISERRRRQISRFLRRRDGRAPSRGEH
jgi:hypothetical protein